MLEIDKSCIKMKWKHYNIKVTANSPENTRVFYQSCTLHTTVYSQPSSTFPSTLLTNVSSFFLILFKL